METCFFCTNINYERRQSFIRINTARVPTSQKPIPVVLSHLAKLIKTTLNIDNNSMLCVGCLHNLSKYDTMMVRLMDAQKKLTEQLRITLNAIRNPLRPEQELVPEETRTIVDEIEIPMPMTTNGDETQTSVHSLMQDEIIETNYNTDNDADSDSDKTFNENSSQNSSSSSRIGAVYITEKPIDANDLDYLPQLKKQREKPKCLICKQTFTSKYQLQNHMNELHKSTPTFKCNICGKICKDEEYLVLHTNIHNGKTENECRYCPKRFSRPVNTLRHMRMHWNKKKYQCEKCGVRFSQDYLLYNHRKRHEAEENPIACIICNIFFKSSKTYNHHMLKHQENRPRHYCTICPKSFTERYTLKVHMKSHGTDLDSIVKNTDTKPTVVQAVDKKLKEISETETEGAVTVILEDNNSGQCVICNVTYSTKKELDNHLKMDHDVVFK